MKLDLTSPVTIHVTFLDSTIPPVVLPDVALDGLSRQRLEVEVEKHLTEQGHRSVVLDIATPAGLDPTLAAITADGVITGTVTTSG